MLDSLYRSFRILLTYVVNMGTLIHTVHCT